MGQKGRVIKVLGVLRALADAPLALDAGAGHLRHVGGIDGPHGTQAGAGAAVGTLAQIRLGLGLQELDGLAVRALGHVVGRRRIARHGHRSRDVRQVFYLVRNAGRELPHLPLVIPVRAAVRQRVRKGVAAGKGAPGHGVEAVRLQRGAQLRQGVVVGPVAEGDHPHRQGAVPVDLLLDIGQHLVGQLSRIGGHTEHHQVSPRKRQILRPV